MQILSLCYSYQNKTSKMKMFIEIYKSLMNDLIKTEEKNLCILN